MSTKQNKLFHKTIFIENEFSYDDDFYVDNLQEGIDNILEATATIVISSHKVINTCKGKKLLLIGDKTLNILYTSTKICNEVLNQRFSKKYINTIDISPMCEVKGINLKIIYADIALQSCTHIILSIMYEITLKTCIMYYISPEHSKLHKDMDCDTYSIVNNKDTCQKFIHPPKY